MQDWIRHQAVLGGKKQVATQLGEWFPGRLGEALLMQAQVPVERICAELAKDERQRLIRQIKQTDLPIHSCLGFAKAEVTAGGVSLAEVDSRNMRSTVVPNLWLAGELLDVDGPIGGYNFQAAFSTGWLAAASMRGDR